ncbi:MAG: hypothetical protein K5907_09855 [Treponema sp.]|nr:hypothetical protein [Treponema sp.]
MAFLLLSFSLLFTSCDNFLNETEVVKKIEGAISYANSGYFIINIDYPSGKGVMKSPAGGEIEKKMTDKFVLCFEPSSDYDFLSWKIFDSNSGKELKNGEYLTVDSLLDAETTCTFTKEPPSDVKLSLVASVVPRAQIISYSPMTSGVLKDSSIKVLFDQNMDYESIYFTNEEINTLLADGIEKKDLLKASVENSENYYGYIKTVNGVQEVFFKNIFIKNNKTDENINKFFEAPVFENPRILSISANSEKLLDDYTQVLVTIENNFFYTYTIDESTQKAIKLSESKKWTYQVNNKTDVDSMVFQKKNNENLFSFTLKQGDETQIIAQNTTPELKWDNNNRSGLDKHSYLQKNEEGLGLYLDVSLQDVTGGSGPDSYFLIKYNHIDNKTFYSADNGQNISGSLAIPYKIYTSEDAIYKGDLPLDLPKEGIYRIYFDFVDRSGNHFYWPEGAQENASEKGFYVIKDTTPPPAVQIRNVSKGSKDDEFNIEYSFTNFKRNFDSKEFVLNVTGDTDFSKTVSVTNPVDGSITVNNIKAGKKYEMIIRALDCAGNETVVKVPVFPTGLSVEGNPSFPWLEDCLLCNNTAKSYNLNARAFYYDGTSKDVSDYAKVSDSVQNVKKEVKFIFNENGVTLSAILNCSCYVAKEDAICLTSARDFISSKDKISNGGLLTTKGKPFGNYPQSSSTLSGTNAYSSNPLYKGWYLGSDGYFYEKYNNNYYKVEPITWYKLCEEDEIVYVHSEPRVKAKKYLVIAKDILEGGIPFYPSTENRTGSSGNIIYPSDYDYSTIRAFLTGSYKEDDTQERKYEGNGFLQQAFPTEQKEYISDIFILSYWDLTNTSYFGEYSGPKNSPPARVSKRTDYTKAKTENDMYYWTQGVPAGSKVGYTSSSGMLESNVNSIKNTVSVTNTSFAGIRPALWIYIPN